MKLSIRDARAAAELLEGQTLRHSVLSKGFARLLEQDGMIIFTRLSARSRLVQVKDPEALKHFLAQKFAVADVNTYITALEAENPTRADLARDSISTKKRSIHPKSGMHLSSPNAAVVTVGGIEITLDFPPYCALFIHRDAEVSVSEDVVIVGVENFENVTFATRQSSVINRSAPMVFVERGPAMRSWVTSLKNEYIHYGDIDLAGIGIYLYEYEPYIKAPHSFFLPAGIEDLIAHNTDPDSRRNYEKQLPQYRNISTKDPQLQAVIKLVHDHKGGIEQESLIAGEG